MLGPEASRGGDDGAGAEAEGKEHLARELITQQGGRYGGGELHASVLAEPS